METSPIKADVLGIASLSKSVEILTQGVVDGASALFGRVCLPAAEELGLFFQDKIKGLRSRNATEVLRKAEQILGANEYSESASAPPHVVAKIIEESSWISDPYLQDLWAGLLASSCSDSGEDDRNVRYLSLLSRMTKLDVQVLDFLFNTSEVENLAGVATTTARPYSIKYLRQTLNNADIGDIVVSILSLERSGLVDGDINLHERVIFEDPPSMLRLTPLALFLCLRCKGVATNPFDYFEHMRETQQQ